MQTSFRILTGLAPLLCAAPASAQYYVELPAGSWCSDVTPDERIVVGTWSYGADGFIWRWQEDRTPSIIPGGDVIGVSDDGSVVVGNITDPTLNVQVTAIWTAAGGWQGLG